MSRSTELKKQRRRKTNDLQDMLGKLDDEGRDAFTAAETRAYDRLAAEVEALDDEILEARRAEAVETRSVDRPAKNDPDPGAPAVHTRRARDYDRPYSLTRALRHTYDKSTNAKVELRASAEIAEVTERSPEGLFVPYSALLTRAQRAEMEQRAIGKGTPNTTGAAVVATDLIPEEFIEVLRNSAKVLQAGARPLTNLVGDVDLPRQSAAASATWLAENGPAIESTLTTDTVSLTPKTIGLKGTITRRMMKQSSPAIDDLVGEDTRQVLGLGIDLAALSGSGASNQPRGILNTSGIGSVVTGGGLTWAEALEFEEDLGTANALRGALAWMGRATVLSTAKGTAKDAGSGQFVMQGGRINEYSVHQTEQVGASTLIFGNWNELLIGMWGGLDLFADPYSDGDAGNVIVRGFQDVDIALRHAASFTVATDI